MRFRCIVISILILLFACNEQKSNNETNKVIKPVEQIQDTSLLKGVIEAFISNEQVKSNVITVQCTIRSDSLKFFIVDSYPSLDDVQMLGYTVIGNYTVCFVGDEIPLNFINLEHQEVPSEVKKKNEEFRNLKDVSQLKRSEPFSQTVCFKGNNLIQCPIFPVY